MITGGLTRRRGWFPRSLRGHWSGSSRSKLPAVAGGAAALALVAAACTGGGGGAVPTGGTPAKGGTAVVALPPAATPDYIFPFASSAYISVVNASYLTNLMYRPLYWFGDNGQPAVNPSLSLADLPTVKGTTVTIRLKHYKWSNGTPVTARDVMFWLNMLRAQPGGWGAYTGFPANVKSITVVSPSELTMVTDKAYNPTWFLYNELSQITPMPPAWDRTASGPRNCTANAGDCGAVYSYLSGQARDTATYASSSLWSVVDGPWRLKSFSADGHVTFVPNKSYSGPVKPRLSALREVPFATDAAEYRALQSHGTKIDVGYLPQQDAPAKPADAVAGDNPLSGQGYALAPWPDWGINYYVLNYQSSNSGHAAIFGQLYFRQALQYLMNQAAVISGPLHGYGTATVGPVAANPPSRWLSPKARQGDPFPYNPAQAKQLLASHGWKVTPGGVTTCTQPSRCGPGIARGSRLSFSLPYTTGTGWIASEMKQLASNAEQVGIRLNLEPGPAAQVTALAAGNCQVTKASCDWDMADWGSGWSFSPDYAPTGESLFMSGALANSGGYASPADDSMITQTLSSGSLQLMYRWQNYLATQLPVMWQPDTDYQLTEIAGNLRGVTPQSPTLMFNPENWYFVK